MSVISIEDLNVVNDAVTVTAVVDDARVVFRATYNDPEELGPGLCSASFFLGEDVLPKDEDDLLSYIDSLDLEWQLVEE
jgi:hypothetical protein